MPDGDLGRRHNRSVRCPVPAAWTRARRRCAARPDEAPAVIGLHEAGAYRRHERGGVELDGDVLARLAGGLLPAGPDLRLAGEDPEARALAVLSPGAAELRLLDRERQLADGEEVHRHRSSGDDVQATERFYHWALLTLTLYSPKSHKLNVLRSQAERVAPELIPTWPRGERFNKRCWELLRRAYVEARYSPHYSIAPDELAWLVARVADPQQRVEAACRTYLAQTAPKT
jgi:hypothetical protein